MFRYCKNLHVSNFFISNNIFSSYLNKYSYKSISYSSKDVSRNLFEIQYITTNHTSHRSLSRIKTKDRFIKKNDHRKKDNEMNLFKGIKVLPNTEKSQENLGEELGGKLERGW